MDKKRLVFRHHKDIFETRSKAEAYFGSVVNPESIYYLDGGAKYGEPLVAQYYEEDGKTKSVILGIGTDDGYILIDGSDIKAQLASLTERMGFAESDIDSLEKQLQEEIERAKAAETSIHDELDGAIAGAGLEEHTGKYIPNEGTPNHPIAYINEATSLKDADEKLDTALQALDKEVVKHVIVNPGKKMSKIEASIKDNTARFTLTTDNILIDEEVQDVDDFSNKPKTVEIHHGGTVSEIIEAINNVLAEKVDCKDGMSLMSDAEHEKLSGIEEGANVNVIDKVYERDNILQLDGKTLKSNLSLEYDKEQKKIFLKGISGTTISEISVEDFIKDGMLEKAEIRTYDGVDYLVLILNTDGEGTEIKIPLDKFFNIYTVAEDSIDYLKIDGYKISVKVDENGLATLTALDDAVGSLKDVDDDLDDKIDKEIEDRKDEITRLETSISANTYNIATLNGGTELAGSVRHTILEDTMIAEPVTITADKVQGNLLRRTGDKIYASNLSTDIYDVDKNAPLSTSLATIRDSIDSLKKNQDDKYKELKDAISAEESARTEEDKAIRKDYTAADDAIKAAYTAADEIITNGYQESDRKLEESVEKAKREAKDDVASALTDAIAYADSLADNYDAKGEAASALTNAKAYADEIVSALTEVYDAKGAAEAAETNAKAYADEIVSALTEVYDAKGAAKAAEDNAKAHADSAITALTKTLEEKTKCVGITENDIKIEEGPLAGLLEGVYENGIIPAGTKYDSILEKLLVSDERQIYYWGGFLESIINYPADSEYTGVIINKAEDIHFSLPAGSNTVIVAVPNGRAVVDIYLGAKDDEDIMFGGDYLKFQKRKFLNYKKRYNFYRYTFEKTAADINEVIVEFE